MVAEFAISTVLGMPLLSFLPLSPLRSACEPCPLPRPCAAGIPRGLPGSFLGTCASLRLPLRLPQRRRRRPLGRAGSRDGEVRIRGATKRASRQPLCLSQVHPPMPFCKALTPSRASSMAAAAAPRGGHTTTRPRCARFMVRLLPLVLGAFQCSEPAAPGTARPPPSQTVGCLQKPP